MLNEDGRSGDVFVQFADRNVGTDQEGHRNRAAASRGC